MIDLHCHLDLYDRPQDIVAEVVRRRLYVLSVTTTPSAFEGTRRLAGDAPRIRTALGLHPELAAARAGELELFEKLLPEAEYVGEIGLDGSPEHRGTLARQAEILTHILQLCARAGGRGLSLHSRGAASLILDVLSVEPAAGTPVLHWYVGTDRQIARAAELGAWFSVGPSMLASKRGQSAVQAMPPQRILPESDGPFGELGGRPAMPWEAWRVATPLAHIWGVTTRAAEERLAENFRAFSSSATRAAP